MKKKAIFLDRDGTINEEMGYINHLSRFRIFPNSFHAIRLINRANYLALIVTNQSGAARGYTPVDFVEEVHAHLTKEMAKNGARIDDIFVCMHRKDSKIPELRVDCNCRKPKTGLIEQALAKYDIDLKGSYVIGDRLVDIEMGKKMGLKTILVKTGYGLGEIQFLLPESEIKPDFIAQDILEAVRFAISH